MIDFKIFFNTRIENSGLLSGIGNFGLSFAQYLWNGCAIQIETELGPKITMHLAFDKKNDCFCMKMIKTVISIALLIPGLILSLFKAAAYLSTDVRDQHALVKEYLTGTGRFKRIDMVIGDAEHPIKSIDELEKALRAETEKNKNPLVGALTIYGDGNLDINEDPGILELDPMKVIFVGAKIIHRPSATGRLIDKIRIAGEWQSSEVSSVTAALKASVDTMDNGQPFHMLYTLPQTQLA